MQSMQRLSHDNEENFENTDSVCDQSSVKRLAVSTHPLVFGFLVEALLYSLHPQLLLGRVHVEERFSAQVQFLKTRVLPTSNTM